MLHAQGVADSQDPFADPDLGRVAQDRNRKVLAADLDQGQVGPGVGAHDLGRVVVALDGDNLDLGGVLHEVVVGQDEAVGRDEEARAHGRGSVFLFPAAGLAEEPVPEVVEGRIIESERLPLFHPFALDLDHGRADVGRDLGEVQVSPDFRGRGVEVRGIARGFQPVGRRRGRGGLVRAVYEHVAGQEKSEDKAGQGDDDRFFHHFLLGNQT